MHCADWQLAQLERAVHPAHEGAFGAVGVNGKRVEKLLDCCSGWSRAGDYGCILAGNAVSNGFMSIENIVSGVLVRLRPLVACYIMVLPPSDRTG